MDRSYRQIIQSPLGLNVIRISMQIVRGFILISEITEPKVNVAFNRVNTLSLSPITTYYQLSITTYLM